MPYEQELKKIRQEIEDKTNGLYIAMREHEKLIRNKMDDHDRKANDRYATLQIDVNKSLNRITTTQTILLSVVIPVVLLILERLLKS